MKKTTIITIYFFLIMSNTFAQYPTNIFKNYTPRWQHPVYDSTAIPPMNPEEDNGMRYRNSIFQDSFIYSLFEYKYILKPYANGGHIEKLNLYTGNLEWTTTYDLRTIDNNERPNRIFFNKFGELEVLGFRKRIREESNNHVVDPLFKLISRKYNPTNGELITKVYEKDDDSLGYLMYGLSTVSSLCQYEMKNYQYIFNYSPWGLDNTSSVILDTLGIAIDTLTYDINNKYPEPWITPFRMLSPDTMVSILFDANNYNKLDDSFDINFYILLIDQDFNHIDSFNITDDINAKNRFQLHLEYIDDEAIIVGLINEPELFQWKYNFLIFDYSGNLVDSIDLNDVWFQTCAIKRISDDEFIVYGTTKEHDNDDHGNFRFYKKKIGEKKKLLREIEVKEKEKYFFCREIHLIDNDIILIGNYSGDFGFGCCEYRYPMLVDFPSNDILDYVNTQNEEFIIRNEIRIYPNPAQDILTIEYPANFTGNLEIFDELGRKILVQKIESSKKYNLDISKLNVGIYLLKATDTKHNNIYKSVNFVVK